MAELINLTGFLDAGNTCIFHYKNVPLNRLKTILNTYSKLGCKITYEITPAKKYSYNEQTILKELW